MKEDTANWREETDLIMGFIRACVEHDPTSNVLATDMLEAFNRHVGANSHLHWTDRTFVQQFGSHELHKGHGVIHRRTRDHSKVVRPMRNAGSPIPAQVWVWTGVRLKDDSDAALYTATTDWNALAAIAINEPRQEGANHAFE